MDERDFRGIGRPAQEGLRRRALMLILQQGMSQAEAARVVGVQRQTVNIWLQRYRAQGDDGVLDGRRVSPRRGKGRLTAEEAGQVQGWIRDRTPDQLGGLALAQALLFDQEQGPAAQLLLRHSTDAAKVTCLHAGAIAPASYAVRYVCGRLVTAK